VSRIGQQIMEGLDEALAHARGEAVPGLKVHHVEIDDVDPKTVRRRLKLTQEQMAGLLGTSTSGYRKWEQGNRAPSGAARTLLRVMEREPDAVLRALAE